MYLKLLVVVQWYFLFFIFLKKKIDLYFTFFFFRKADRMTSVYVGVKLEACRLLAMLLTFEVCFLSQFIIKFILIIFSFY